MVSCGALGCANVVSLWCSGYCYCTTSFSETWTRVLRMFKSSSWHVRDLRWWGSLTVVPAGNKAKRLLSVNHTTKTIHHRYNNDNVIITTSHHIHNPGIFNVWGIFKTLSNILDDEAYWEPWLNQNSLLRHFQAYSGTFSNIKPCSGILTDIEAYSGIIEAYCAILRQIYSELCVTLAYTMVPYSGLWHI